MAKIQRSTQAGSAGSTGAAVLTPPPPVQAKRPVAPAHRVDVVETPRALTRDGKAFVAEVFDQLAKLKPGDVKPRVVFDIDDTLADTRVRSLCIAKAWDAANGTHYFDTLTLEGVGHTAADTVKAFDLGKAEQAFLAHWETAFWDGDNFQYDVELPETVALVKQLQAAGAEVVFLTGRTADREGATVIELQRFGLDANADNVVTKPDLDTRTVPFKTAWLRDSIDTGHPVSFFFTESRRDIAGIQDGRAGCANVLLDSPFPGTEEVEADTPFYPKAHARQAEVDAMVARAVAAAVAPKPVLALPPVVDGVAFIEAALKDIEARVARREKVRVGFDIDDTLADTRPRTLGLAKQWDEDHHTHYFDTLELTDVKFDIKETLKKVDLPWETEVDFLKFFNVRFKQGSNFRFDEPIAAIVELAKRAKQAGAEVIYLTGRVALRTPRTIEELHRFGLTDANMNNVVGKPVDEHQQSPDTPEFKAAWLEQSALDGYHLAWFITESKKDIAEIQDRIDGAPTVLIDHAFNGPEEVKPDTPIYPRPV